jgi:hypothetical protein
MAYVQPSTKAPGNNPKNGGKWEEEEQEKKMMKNPWGEHKQNPAIIYIRRRTADFPKKRPQGERASECKDTQDKRNEEVSGTEMGDGFNPHSSENMAKTTGRYHEKRKVVTGLFPRDTKSSTESSRGKKKKGSKRSEWICFLSVHAPFWAQTGHHVVLGADHVSWQPANTIVAHANVVHVGVGDARAVAADTASIAGSVAVLEPGWRCKVQTRECARFPQGVTEEGFELVRYHTGRWVH